MFLFLRIIVYLSALVVQFRLNYSAKDIFHNVINVALTWSSVGSLRGMDDFYIIKLKAKNNNSENLKVNKLNIIFI